MVKEGTGGCCDLNIFATTRYAEDIEGFDWRLCLALGCTKCREVMMANQVLGGGVHCDVIQLNGDLPGVSCFNGERTSAVDDPIDIMPCRGVESGVERVAHFLGLDDRHRMGSQMGVDSVLKFPGVEWFFDICVCDLPAAMNTSVRAARGGYRHVLAREFQDCVLDSCLNRRSIFLSLPANEWLAVVFNGQFPALHRQVNCAPTGIGKPRRSSADD